MDTRITPVRARIQAVQAALAARGWHALLVPSADPHLSEYLPERWMAREWLSGFTGSMGTLVVSVDRALLFADSRYWVQAEAELAGSGIELERVATGGSTAHVDWLAAHTPRGGTVAVDGRVLALSTARALREALERSGATLRSEVDLVDEVWSGRPALPGAPVYEHAAPHASTPRADKLAAVRAAMRERGATHHFVSSVDDIAWITNLRGSDVDYNPVFLAHLLVDAERATLFVDAGKVDAALTARLAADGIAIAPYAGAGDALAALGAGDTLLVDPKRITLGLRERAACRVVEATNPSTLAKSRKTDAEAAQVREAMIEDGVAMCAFYAWFEQAQARGERITEITVDDKLSAERAKRAGFVGLSFPVIAGFNANGAMPHYRATPATDAAIRGNGLLLIDSGGQYLGGTTDITRVWPIGSVGPAIRRDATLVLRGLIALTRARFPRGTLAPMLDALARAPLWEHGLDYGHGTGHGVGYFLNVHEGPQSFSKAIPTADMAMQPGMITSIEPGLYRTGRWGVRIENLVLAVPAPASDAADGDDFGEFLAFETLTLCPIDTRCLERGLLRADEIAWLDAYHAMVRERLAPRCSGDARAWLEARTQPV
ncbi:MAG: aminopeptidase P family protein [Burkholderiales bacterium]|nr:aminopeptidase P family protein [Burkholderiales bacterium]